MAHLTFLELAKKGQGYQDRLRIWDASTRHSNESMPDEERGDGGQQDEVLIFPEDEHDAVTIACNDMDSLQPGRILSGSIIDFYIKYLQKRLDSRNKDRLHFFNTVFFTKLAKNWSAFSESEQRKAALEKVQKWTGKVNIFEKEFVFIPVHRSSHWSLIIICHLSSLTSSPGKQELPPCILHLDSVEGKHGNLEGHIRSYIVHAWKEKYHYPNEDQLLALSQTKYGEVKVPQQDNHYDCGIYLLHFVEHFLLESLDVGFVPNQQSLFTGLWDASEVSEKRSYIENLLVELFLASRRKFRVCQTRFSRLYQIRPVSQISEVFGRHLDGNVSKGRVEDLQKNDPKHADHQTTGEVALDNQQHTGIALLDLLTIDENVSDDQQREQLKCATLKPEKERSKRCKNWSKKATSILLDCKKEGGRFCKGNQNTDWIAVSQEIENKLGTIPPSGDQCQNRYDTLLKAYKRSNLYCKKHGKQFSELCQSELDKLKLETNLTEDWFDALDEIDEAKSSKRVKSNPGDDEGEPASTSPRHSPHRSPPIHRAYSEFMLKGLPDGLLPCKVATGDDHVQYYTMYSDKQN